MAKKRALKLEIDRRLAALILALALLGGAGYVLSETYDYSMYLPSPSGVFAKLIATGDTFLARDSGGVAIGSSAPVTATQKLRVDGMSWFNGNMAIVGTLKSNAVKVGEDDVVSTIECGTGLVCRKSGNKYTVSLAAVPPPPPPPPPSPPPTSAHCAWITAPQTGSCIARGTCHEASFDPDTPCVEGNNGLTQSEVSCFTTLPCAFGTGRLESVFTLGGFDASSRTCTWNPAGTQCVASCTPSESCNPSPMASKRTCGATCNLGGDSKRETVRTCRCL